MAVKIAPSMRQQFEDGNGNPYVGGKLFTYAAGSSTKQATYTDSTGSTANTNPIILDAAGRTPSGVWLTDGLTYKFVLAPSTDTDPPTSPIFTEDVVSGVNDTATATSQWKSSGSTPTYINTTQFTLVGDKTADFHVGRRLKFTVTAGTVYGLITVSAYTTLTTVTVVMDSGALDSGLSAVELSILTATAPSLPKLSSTNLTAIGVQPLDATTTALAALDATAGLVEQTGADAFTKRAIGTATGNVPLWENTTLNSTVAKTAAYTVVAADRGKLIDASGTWTLSLTEAATLGTGFSFAIRNSGTGIVTIDPNASESIDGALTLDVLPGESFIVTGDQTVWRTVCRTIRATSAEAQALTNRTNVITPATLADALKGTNQSLATSGYQKLPGGLIIQWGTFSLAAAASSTQAITFPVAFPTALIHPSVSVDVAATDMIGTTTSSLTGMTISKGASDTTARTGFWQAIGY